MTPSKWWVTLPQIFHVTWFRRELRINITNDLKMPKTVLVHQHLQHVMQLNTTLRTSMPLLQPPHQYIHHKSPLVCWCETCMQQNMHLSAEVAWPVPLAREAFLWWIQAHPYGSWAHWSHVLNEWHAHCCKAHKEQSRNSPNKCSLGTYITKKSKLEWMNKSYNLFKKHGGIPTMNDTG